MGLPAVFSDRLRVRISYSRLPIETHIQPGSRVRYRTDTYPIHTSRRNAGNVRQCNAPRRFKRYARSHIIAKLDCIA